MTTYTHLLTRVLFTAVLAIPAAISGCGDDPPPGVTPIITSFTAEPGSVAPGGTSVLRWATTDAVTVQVAIQGGAVLLATSPMPAGMLTTPALDETTTFILTAASGDQSSTKSVTVTVRQPGAAVIDSFTATPSSVGQGQSSTLAWQTTNAVSGAVRVGGDVIHEIPAADLGAGTFEVTINAPTTFVLAVKGSDDVEVTSEQTVTLSGPLVVSFLAMPSSIVRGESATLVYNVRNATGVAITGNASGEVYRGATLMGQVTVRPTMTETYTIVASDAGGATATDTEVVTVNDPNGARIVSFLASPTAIDPGQSATLAWEVANAPGGIEISAGGQAIFTSMDTIGVHTVSPTATTEYTLRAINAQLGDGTARVTIAVGTAVPDILGFEARPNPGPLGGSSSLSWTIRDADAVRVLRGARELFSSSAAADPGRLAVELVAMSTTYTLEVSNAQGGNTASVRVFAHDPPAIITFTVMPETFTGGMATAMVSWNVSSAATLDLTANGAPATGFTPVRGPNAQDLSGTLMLSVSASTVLELVATSGGGTARATAIIGAATNEVEPNDTPATAQSVPGDGTAVGATFGTPGDEDHYSVVVPQGGHVYARTSDGMGGCSADTVVDLIAPDGTTVVTSNDDEGATTCSLIDWRLDPDARDLEAGTYYVRVTEFNDDTGAYTLFVVAGGPECGNGVVETRAPAAESCDDGNGVAGDGCDATCSGEPLVTFTGPVFHGSVVESIAFPGEVDLYRIEMTADGYLAAETFAPGAGACDADTFLRLLDDNLAPIPGAEDDDDGLLNCSRIDPTGDAFARLAPGTYYLAVTEFSGNDTIGLYQLDIDLVGLGCGNGIQEMGELCDDGNTTNGDGCDMACMPETMSENEAGGNNTFDGAGVVVIDADGVWFASISPVADQDWYAIDVPQDHHIDVTVTVDSLTECPEEDPRMQLRLYDSDGTTLRSNNSTAGANGTCGRIWPYTSLGAYRMSAGRYYIRVNELGDDAVVQPYYLHARIIVPGCGNGVREAAEQCDDGNGTSGDGCTGACMFEPVAVHTAPSAMPGVYAGSIDFPGEIDVFQIDVVGADSQYLHITSFAPTVAAGTCPAPTDTVLRLYTFDLTPITFDDDGGVEACSDIPFSAALLAPGTYWLFVEEFDNNSTIGAYELLIEDVVANVCGNGVREGELCDDGNTTPGDGCDAACSPEFQANQFSPPGATYGVTLAPGGSAYFIVNTAQEGSSIAASAADVGLATCDVADTRLTLLDGNFDPVGTRSGGGPVGNAGVCAELDPVVDSFAGDLYAAPWYLHVESETAGGGAIEVSVTIEGPSCGNNIIERLAMESCDDGNTTAGDGCGATCVSEVVMESEPNNDRTTADVTGLNGPGIRTAQGEVNRTGAGDTDYYSFVVPAGPARTLIATTYSVFGLPHLCNNNTGDTELQLEDASGGVLAMNEDAAMGVFCAEIDGTDTLLNPGAAALAPGTYYLRVRQSPVATPGATPYYLDVRLQ